LACAASASFRTSSAWPRTFCQPGCARWSTTAYSEYVLTPKGRGTFPILVALRQWCEEYDDHPEEIATILVDREKGRPVKKLEMHAEDGRLLTPADTTLKPRPAPRRRSA
jgi:hypothetical protein